jgi:subtilisin family serine protease
MKYLLLLLLPLISYAESPMDIHRWYLKPDGQEILVSIDDLHDEHLIASPSMDWGRGVIEGTTLKKDILIAVIDGGIDIEHPELKNNIAYNSAECFEGTIIPPKDSEDKDKNGYKGDCAGWDFVNDSNRPEDLDGHGTHVTGVINSALTGIQGNYKFLPLKVFAPDEGKQNSNVSTPLSVRLTRAFEYALSRNADVIHMSVGWPKSYMSGELEAVIKKAIDKGVLVVAAAGNSSQRATIYPCQLNGVICVGALRPDGSVARFSNWGGQVDIYAPGEKILSTIPNTIAPLYISRKGYDFKNGTSQAAPFISAALGVLRGSFPEEQTSKLYARLMKGADEAKEGRGLKGLFHIDRSLSLLNFDFVYPDLKGIHSVLIGKEGEFTITLPFKNFGDDRNISSKISMSCSEATLAANKYSLTPLKNAQSESLSFSGVLNKKSGYLNCQLDVNGENVSLRLKILETLSEPFKKVIVSQPDLYVVNTRNGARSRFITMSAVNGTTPGPYYYVAGDKTLSFYKEDKVIGSPVLPQGCSFLRIWQIDYDHDSENEFMMETLCEKTYLRYFFLDKNLKELYPSVKYKPVLTILNYEEFEVTTSKDLPPVFRFLNGGFSTPTDSPWDSDVTTNANHLYEFVPVKDGASYKYDVKLLENPEAWMKPLGLRYKPAYDVLHKINGKLLIKIGLKTAWINIADQKAEWANLQQVLLAGSRKQNILGSDEVILQSLLTPYEYRGFILPDLKLRFIQEDKFDPFIDVLGTEKNSAGHKVTLRTFQKLIYLQFNSEGEIIDRKESIVDRFDFLTAQDLIASVVNLVYQNTSIQLVDGTKINTNYVDVMINGEIRSFEIPSSCVTQQPVILDGKATLPIFCGKTKAEFEMRFIELPAIER